MDAPHPIAVETVPWKQCHGNNALKTLQSAANLLQEAYRGNISLCYGNIAGPPNDPRPLTEQPQEPWTQDDCIIGIRRCYCTHKVLAGLLAQLSFKRLLMYKRCASRMTVDTPLYADSLQRISPINASLPSMEAPSNASLQCISPSMHFPL
eukprot:1158437-Pelagomonas_calceolata.AAC.5